MQVNLGAVFFENEIRVTDPCYDKGVHCSYVMKDCREGVWNASIEREHAGCWGMRVSMLEIRHVAHSKDEVLRFKKVREADIGVDSGQAGFFIESAYPTDEKEFEYEDNTFYGKVCNLTLDMNERNPNPLHSDGGVNEFGCVSRSGYGDGSYNLAVSRNAEGKIIAARIYFM